MSYQRGCATELRRLNDVPSRAWGAWRADGVGGEAASSSSDDWTLLAFMFFARTKPAVDKRERTVISRAL
jgi:hypothetical protein